MKLIKKSVLFFEWDYYFLGYDWKEWNGMIKERKEKKMNENIKRLMVKGGKKEKEKEC